MLEKLKNISNKKIVIITSIVMLLVLIAGVSYAIWSRSFTQTGTNLSKYDCFDIVYAENVNEVSLSNGYPITDEEGLKAESYDLTIKNTCKILANYEVVLNKLNTSTLNDTNVKIAVDSDISLLSDLKTTNTNLTNATEGKVLTTGILASGQSKTIKIQSWMDENTTKTEGSGKSFSYKVTAEATTGVSSKSLVANIVKNELKTTTPDFSSAEPITLTYKEAEIVEKTVKLSSSKAGNRALGSGYAFDSSTNKYTLTDITQSQTFDDSSIGKYTCNNSNGTSCRSVYKIKEVDTTSSTSYNYITLADYYSSTDDSESTGSGLYKSTDDDGDSYYFRGNVNNYVSFANQLWRVIRVNGDGTIRLLYNTDINKSAFNNVNDDEKYSGYTYDNANVCTKENPCSSSFDAKNNLFVNNMNMTNSDVKTYLENWYISNLKLYDNYISLESYCNDTTGNNGGGSSYYGAYARIYEHQPSLKCPDTSQLYGGNYKLKIGLMTADEANYAGLSVKAPHATTNNYLYYSSNWWFMTPCAKLITSNATLSSESTAASSIGITPQIFVTYTFYVRPVINLKSNTLITSGDGSLSNPYVIK
ncbi:MAG TPA: hypothetical protein OIM63_03640 [Bacilli bacterium]|nr:hypothetical protein [Bacilli bacterium]